MTDETGKPFSGSTVVSIYDKSVEYISGGSNVPEIKEHFWKWRRHHYPRTESSLQHWYGNLLRRGEVAMSNLGMFGQTVVEELAKGDRAEKQALNQMEYRRELASAPAAGFAGRGEGNATKAFDMDGLRDAKGGGEQTEREGT